MLAYQQLTLGCHQSELSTLQEDLCKLWAKLEDRFQWVSDTFAEISGAYLNSNQAIQSSLQQLSTLQTELPAYVMDQLCDYD